MAGVFRSGGDVGECGGHGEGSDCVPVDLPVWTLTSASVSTSVSVFKTLLSYSLSFPKRKSSDALTSCQKKVKMNMEASLVEVVSQAVGNRPAPQNSSFTTIPECVRNKTSPSPEGTPPQEGQT